MSVRLAGRGVVPVVRAHAIVTDMSRFCHGNGGACLKRFSYPRKRLYGLIFLLIRTMQMILPWLFFTIHRLFPHSLISRILKQVTDHGIPKGKTIHGNMVHLHQPG